MNAITGSGSFISSLLNLKYTCSKLLMKSPTFTPSPLLKLYKLLNASNWRLPLSGRNTSSSFANNVLTPSSFSSRETSISEDDNLAFPDRER